LATNSSGRLKNAASLSSENNSSWVADLSVSMKPPQAGISNVRMT
jgi:hypothetical protein